MDELDNLVAATNHRARPEGGVRGLGLGGHNESAFPSFGFEDAIKVRPHSVPDWLVQTLDNDPTGGGGSHSRQRLPRMLPRSGSRLAAAEVASGDGAGTHAVRPRAPISSGSVTSLSPKDGSMAPESKKKKSSSRRNKARRKKLLGHGKSPSSGMRKMSLEESWENLHHFSVTNLGRRLDDGDGGGKGDGEVHFVNIDDMENDLSRNLDVISFDDDAQLFKVHEAVETRDGHGVVSMESTSFEIPVLPRGSQLVINILSTWGDPYYVGLMGLEMFDSNGHLIALSNVDEQLGADPPDINVLPEYNNDPRTVDKLLDGHNHTCDDMHAWLAPFRSGADHCLFITLDAPTSIAMMRFWNYNKSRIHSYRGARYVEIALDGRCIFKGEIQRAPGAMLGSDSCAECILFTTDENVLRIIERYDKHPENTAMMGGFVGGKDVGSGIDLESKWRHGWGGDMGHVAAERPRTAGVSSGSIDVLGGEGRSSGLGSSINDQAPISSLGADGRPLTAAGGRAGDTGKLSIVSQPKQLSQRPKKRNRPKTAPLSGSASKPVVGRVLEMRIGMSWGNSDMVGLTSLKVLDVAFKPIEILPGMLTCSPTWPWGQTPTTPDDPLHRLIDGHDNTDDADRMFLAPCRPYAQQYILRIDFGRQVGMQGLKFWNYNASLDDSFMGVKRMIVSVDGHVLSPAHGFLIRKAPGDTQSLNDFGQFVPLKRESKDSLPQSGGKGQGAATTGGVSSTIAAARASARRRKMEQRKQQQTATSEQWNMAGGLEPVIEKRFQQQYETPLLPCGCIFKFVLVSTHGDPHYVGLNGLELYDEQNQLIPLDETNVEAVPTDINQLPFIVKSGVKDVRTLDKLYDGINTSSDDAHIWLAPLQTQPNPSNSIFVYLDDPICLSKIKIWNYSKTPARGCHEIEVLIDDVLVYRGALRKAKQDQRGGRATDNCSAILFTDSEAVIEDEIDNVYNPGAESEGHCVFMDSGTVVDTLCTDGTSQRPTTSAGGHRHQ